MWAKCQLTNFVVVVVSSVLNFAFVFQLFVYIQKKLKLIYYIIFLIDMLNEFGCLEEGVSEFLKFVV